MAKKKATSSPGSQSKPLKKAVNNPTPKRKATKKSSGSRTVSSRIPKPSPSSVPESPSPSSTRTERVRKPLLPIPDWLLRKPVACAKWRELLEELQIRNQLVTIDLGLFALFCEAWQAYSEACTEVEEHGLYFTTDKGYVAIHPAELVKDKTVKRIISIGDRLGIGVHARKGLHKSETGGGDGTAEQDPLVAYAKLKIK